MRILVGRMCKKTKKKQKIQSVLVDCQREIGRTLRVKHLTWGHGPNFGSPEIWVVTVLLPNYSWWFLDLFYSIAHHLFLHL